MGFWDNPADLKINGGDSPKAILACLTHSRKIKNFTWFCLLAIIMTWIHPDSE